MKRGEVRLLLVVASRGGGVLCSRLRVPPATSLSTTTSTAPASRRQPRAAEQGRAPRRNGSVVVQSLEVCGKGRFGGTEHGLRTVFAGNDEKHSTVGLVFLVFGFLCDHANHF